MANLQTRAWNYIGGIMGIQYWGDERDNWTMEQWEAFRIQEEEKIDEDREAIDLVIEIALEQSRE